MLDSLRRSVITTILTVIFTFAVGVVVARILGPEQRGQLGYVMVIGSLIWSFCNLGLHDSYIYFKRSKYNNVGSKNLFVLVFFASLSVALTLSIIVFKFIDSDYISNVYFVLLILSYVFYYLTMHLLQLQDGMVKYNLVKLFLPILNIVILFFINKGATTELVTIMYVVSYVLLGLYAFSYLIKTEFLAGKWFKLEAKPLCDYAFKSYGVAVFGVLISNFDKVFFFWSGKPSDFGIYIVAYSISRNISLIPNTLATVLFANYAGRDEKGLAKAAANIYSLLFFPMLILYVLISSASFVVLPILFGAEYDGVSLPFTILVLEAILSSLGWILAQRFMASGKPGLVLVRQMLSFVPLMAIALMDIPGISMPTKIAIAMLVASLVRLVITMMIYKNQLQEDIPRINFSIIEIYKTFKLGLK